MTAPDCHALEQHQDLPADGGVNLHSGTESNLKSQPPQTKYKGEANTHYKKQPE
jgi:hypothetical protein